MMTSRANTLARLGQPVDEVEYVPTDADYPYVSSGRASATGTEDAPGDGGIVAPGSTGTVASELPVLYKNASGGAILFEHGNYRWLQPSEVASAATYVASVGGATQAIDDTKWAEIAKAQQGAGSSDMTSQAVPAGQYAGSLRGFDATKLADTTHNSPKYVFARIASQFNTKDADQRKAMLAMLQADPSGYFKNATLGGSKGDQLVIGGVLDPKFDGINQFDVFQGAGAGEWLPTWQPTGGPGYKADTTPPDAPTTPVPVVVPATPYTPRDYGATPVFGSVDFGQPVSGVSMSAGSISPEAYRRLVAQQQQPVTAPLSDLALTLAQRKR
ncbi:MAG: hypothetical protein NTY02_17135 [Acidobacteria bacterium]|nr:hypothetical protein [Acidobacteriota bacterium]